MQSKLVPIAKAPDSGVPLDAKTLNWISFWRRENGAEAAGAIVKAGGRVFVDPARFDEWMRSSPRFSPPGVRRRTGRSLATAAQGRAPARPRKSGRGAAR